MHNDWNMDPRAIKRRKRKMKSVTNHGNRHAMMRLWRLTLIQLWGSKCNWDPDLQRPTKILLNRKCQVDDPDEIDFAHVHGKETGLNGMGRGSFQRLKDVFDHPDSYVLLCKKHHREYDK